MSNKFNSLSVYTKTDVALFDTKGWSKAKAYFGRVVKGQPAVYTAPFAEGESTENLLSSWMSELEAISKEWPSLMDFEKDLASKVGPLSVMKPLSKRIDDIEAYYTLVEQPGIPILPEAIRATWKEWIDVPPVTVRTEEHTVEGMRLSTNSGNPFFAKRRDVVGKTIPMQLSYYDGERPYPVYQKLSNHWRHGRLVRETNYRGTPAVSALGWRGQEGGLSEQDVKQRVVWMFPFAVNIAELQVYQPLIQQAQLYELVPAWVSMESVDRRITKLFDSKDSNDLVICTDFSKFDQHFNVNLQSSARQILDHLLRPDAGTASWLHTIFPIKYNIPLLCDFDDSSHLLLYTGSHGMGSGSGGTNFDETLAHRSLQHEAAIMHSKTLNPNSQCLGDDGILSYPGITVEDVISSYSSHGQEMNPDKQYVSKEDCVYLRRWHHNKYRVDGVCVGVYSTCRALGRLRYLERFYDPDAWGKEAVALRQLSILENIKYHPLREQFVQFCMKRDRYRLGLDIPGFLDNVERKAKELEAYMPDFLGYTKSQQYRTGLDSWWIIKYLRSL